MLKLAHSGIRYQAPIYLGSGKNKAMVAFETGSSYTTVTSDLCSNCATKAYKPGTSDTEDNLGTQWQLEIDQGGHKTNLKTFAFTDTVSG